MGPLGGGARFYPACNDCLWPGLLECCWWTREQRGYCFFWASVSISVTPAERRDLSSLCGACGQILWPNQIQRSLREGSQLSSWQGCGGGGSSVKDSSRCLWYGGHSLRLVMWPSSLHSLNSSLAKSTEAEVGYFLELFHFKYSSPLSHSFSNLCPRFAVCQPQCQCGLLWIMAGVRSGCWRDLFNLWCSENNAPLVFPDLVAW